MKPFNKYNCKKRNFPSSLKDCYKIETNNKSTAFNVLVVENDKEEIKKPYISKPNSKREKKVILLTNTDGEKW